MQLDNKKIREIIKKYKEVFDTLEEYDKTHTLQNKRKRIDITLSLRTINNLKKISKKTGIPISRIIEEKLS